MHYRSKCVSGGEVNVGSGTDILNNLAEVNQMSRIDNIGQVRHRRAPGYGVPRRDACAGYRHIAVSRSGHESPVIFCKPIDAEFFVVLQRQFTDNSAQRDLRRSDVHFVQDLLHFHDYLAVAEDNDAVCALIGDELRVSDRDGFGHRVYRLSGKFFRDVQRAAAARRTCLTPGEGSCPRVT